MMNTWVRIDLRPAKCTFYDHRRDRNQHELDKALAPVESRRYPQNTSYSCLLLVPFHECFAQRYSKIDTISTLGMLVFFLELEA